MILRCVTFFLLCYAVYADGVGCSVNNTDWFLRSGGDYVVESAIESRGLVIDSDGFIGNKGISYISGDVVAYYQNNTLFMDWAIYDQRNDHLVAGDHVVITLWPDNILSGAWIDYYLNQYSGVIKDARLLNSSSNLYVSGGEINLLGKKLYRVKHAFLTSCNVEQPAWHITADSISLNYYDSVGIAKDMRFYAGDYTILYVPYFSFPLGERKSGFLLPSPRVPPSNIGYLMLDLPYYWNMAPNYDMTIDPRFYTKAGFMLTDEFRFMTHDFVGEAYTEQMPLDLTTGAYRYDWHIVADLVNKTNLNWSLKFNQVSDNNYFNDFGNFQSATSNINLEQSTRFNYDTDIGILGVNVQQFQTLQVPGQTMTPIYAMLPDINFFLKSRELFNSGAYTDLFTQYVFFENSNDIKMQQGQRIVIYPSAWYPLQQQWGHIVPKIGLNYTNYQLQQFPGFNNNNTALNRVVPLTSVDTGLLFERSMQLSGINLIQTFEPRLYYLYVPSVYQGNTPTFDTALATFNVNRLFSENIFAGLDRINAANDITVGFNSRIMNDGGSQLFSVAMGYKFFLSPVDNFLYGSYMQFQQLYQPQPNFITEVSANWASGVTSDADFQYSTIYNTIDAYGVNVRYSAEQHKSLNVGFNYQFNLPLMYLVYIPGENILQSTYENQYLLNLSGQWPISERWIFEGRVNYDFTQQQFLNVIGGIEYDGGCWAVRLVYERYISNLTTYTQQYFLQFELKNLGNIGTGDPIRNLGSNIPGYRPVNINNGSLTEK